MKDYKLNPDKEYVLKIIEGIYRKEGHCPCRVKADETTQRGKKGKKKIGKDEQRNKQKIFKLEEIVIPETITVKDFAAELKKTTKIT